MASGCLGVGLAPFGVHAASSFLILTRLYAAADANHDGSVTTHDIFDLLNVLFAATPF